MAPAVERSAVNCVQVTSGMPKLGRPLGTLPSVDTPSDERSQCSLTAIDPITAISAPGIRGLIFFDPRITAMTATDTQMVAVFASPMSPSVLTNFSTVPLEPSTHFVYVGVGIPSIPPTWPIATWIPTPVRKPISTLRDRKSAMNPSLTSLATISMTPVMMASIPASVTYSGDAIGAMPARPAAMIAAVAESAPTTRCRDEPRSANIAMGMRIV